MGRRKLSEEEKIESKKRRLEYLKKFRKEHGMDYYNKNKEKISKQRRDKREKEKGSPLNSYNKINLKNMTKEEKNEYHKIKNRESRARKKEKMKEIKNMERINLNLKQKYINQIKAIGQHLIDNAEDILSDFDYQHIKEINIVSNIRYDEFPSVEINKSYMPKNIF